MAANPLVKIIIHDISTACRQKHEQISKRVILNAYNTPDNRIASEQFTCHLKSDFT